MNEHPNFDEKIKLKPQRDNKHKPLISKGSPISGFSTNGETTDGKSNTLIKFLFQPFKMLVHSCRDSLKH
jgi:hypothetical protein